VSWTSPEVDGGSGHRRSLVSLSSRARRRRRINGNQAPVTSYINAFACLRRAATTTVARLNVIHASYKELVSLMSVRGVSRPLAGFIVNSSNEGDD
jgi:hypothetical protein